MSIQTYRFAWYDGLQNIEIEVVYYPLKWGVISYFEIQSINPEREPLPITETGYLSHFFHPDSADFSKCGVVEFIKDWLNQETAKPHWRDHIENSRQYQLF